MIGSRWLAFAINPGLPASNNEAERALRMAVIFRKISFGTRTDEGSSSFAAFISVMETCKRRGLNPWNIIADYCSRSKGRKSRSSARCLKNILSIWGVNLYRETETPTIKPLPKRAPPIGKPME